MTLPRMLVEAPAVTPYQYGLRSVAVPGDLTDAHWQMGVEYEQIGTYLASIYPGPCGARPSKTLSAEAAHVVGAPFGIYAGVDCKLVGYSEDYVIARAKAILELGWGHAAEIALWNGGGVSGATPRLNAAGTTTIATGLSMTAGIAALEKYLGDNYAGVGLIHAPRFVAPYMDAKLLVHERTGKLQTVLGTGLAFGGGYDNTGPNNAAPGANIAWLYATGPVRVYRGEAWVNGALAAALNRDDNSTLAYAEQPALLTVDGPPIAAVSVNLTL